MTTKQFNELHIGDMVMNNALTKEVPVLDINRKLGSINTGGSWRRYKNVKLAGMPVPEHFTCLEPVTHVTLSMNMLKRYSLLDAIIISTIRRAGPEGYIGTNETLCEHTQLCRSISTFNTIISRLTHEGIVIRENLAKKASRYTIDAEKAEPYL